ncbi:MAG: hypothetical protein LBK62_14435 [Treponema sp.]|jgi:hypothetical protein|nr:hypothetical protein [Treponema sp.]
MSEGANPQITELIETPDILEVVRDQLAALLSLELENQYALAQDKGIPRARDYNIQVFAENSRPYDGAAIGQGQINLINILVSKVTVPASNPRIGNQKEKAVIFIDCTADGNNTGNFRDDKSAALRAWKIMRLVRRIVMSDQYAYLGMRGTVTSRTFTQMEAGSPTIQAALALTVIRSTLEVEFVERSIEAPSVILEGIDFTVDVDTGQVTAKSRLKDRVLGLADKSQEEQDVTSIGN